MQKYQDVVLNNGVNYIGPAIGATVTVLLYPSNAVPTIYSDNGVTPYPSNAITTDSNGRFYFFAANGNYSLTISGSTLVTQTITDISLFDSVSSLNFSSLEVPSGAINGSNTSFTLQNAPIPPAGCIGYVRQGGVGAFLPMIYGIDFSISGATITTSIPPSVSSNLLFSYMY